MRHFVAALLFAALATILAACGTPAQTQAFATAAADVATTAASAVAANAGQSPGNIALAAAIATAPKLAQVAAENSRTVNEIVATGQEVCDSPYGKFAIAGTTVLGVTDAKIVAEACKAFDAAAAPVPAPANAGALPVLAPPAKPSA